MLNCGVGAYKRLECGSECGIVSHRESVGQCLRGGEGEEQFCMLAVSSEQCADLIKQCASVM